MPLPFPQISHNKSTRCPSYLKIVCQLNARIQKTDIPQLIVNFKQYEKWPKRIYNYYRNTIRNVKEIAENQGKSNHGLCSQGQRDGGKDKNAKKNQRCFLGQQLRKQVEKFLVNVYQRLTLIGDFGFMFRQRLSKIILFFCPNMRNFTKTNYLPSYIDQYSKKIINFLQKKTNQIKPIQTNNITPYLIQFEQRAKHFYKTKCKMQLFLDQAKEVSDRLNYFLVPHNNFVQPEFCDRQCIRCTTHFMSPFSPLQNIQPLLSPQSPSPSPSLSIPAFTPTISTPSLCSYPIETYQLKQFSEFSNIDSNVRATMCAMLNEKSGGIILIGCQKIGASVVAKGLYIKEKDKDSLQQKLEGYAGKIENKVKRNQEFFIDFVPVCEVKEDEDEIGGQRRFRVEAIEGVYVCRIVVKPREDYKIYLLKANAEHSTLQVRIQGSSITIPDSEHYQFLVKKFQRDYEGIQKLSNVNNHYWVKCCQASLGKPAYDNRKPQKKPEQSQLQKFQEQPLPYSQKKPNPQKFAPSTSSSQTQQKDINQYKYWTLVVGDKATIQRIIDVCNKNEQKGIKIQKKLFQECKFKLIKTTWIMFHDEKFQVMKKIVDKYKIQYKGNQVKMISSTLYLEVENGIEASQYSGLYQLLTSNFNTSIKDIIQRQSQKKGKPTWVLYFQQLKGSISAYFYLSDLNYTVKFIRGANLFRQLKSKTHQTISTVPSSPSSILSNLPTPLNPSSSSLSQMSSISPHPSSTSTSTSPSYQYSQYQNPNQYQYQNMNAYGTYNGYDNGSNGNYGNYGEYAYGNYGGYGGYGTGYGYGYAGYGYGNYGYNPNLNAAHGYNGNGNNGYAGFGQTGNEYNNGSTYFGEANNMYTGYGYNPNAYNPNIKQTQYYNTQPNPDESTSQSHLQPQASQNESSKQKQQQQQLQFQFQANQDPQQNQDSKQKHSAQTFTFSHGNVNNKNNQNNKAEDAKKQQQQQEQQAW